VRSLDAFSHRSSTRLKVSAHLLHLAPHTPDNPNAFLNLARAFAPTTAVILFPGNLTVAPPKTFQRSLSSVHLFNKPVIFSTRGKNVFPFNTLSPVLLDRDSPVWCSERFFAGGSRVADWAECLWQLWLENFGNIDVRPTTDWVNEPFSVYNMSSIEVSEIHLFMFVISKMYIF
jgi:hypothetical protein